MNEATRPGVLEKALDFYAVTLYDDIWYFINPTISPETCC